MKIKSITIGGWFQRTTLHLTEIFAFFSGKDIVELDSKMLKANLKKFGKFEAERVSDVLEYVEINLDSENFKNTKIKIFEDGLITLVIRKNIDNLKDLKKHIEDLKNFYEGAFSQSLKYLFSRGAPVPKELAKVENIYPFILEIQEADPKDISKIFIDLGDKIHGEQERGQVKLARGKKIMTIEGVTDKNFYEIFSEAEIFFREFKTQLARYLHIHREIWEKINKIKSKNKFTGEEVLRIREELQEEQKTITLIEARINQMPTYLKTRAKLTDISEFSKDFQPLLQYKFETLQNTHEYVKSLWAMTKNYLNSALDMLNVLQNESNKSSISSLTLITTIGVVAGIVNYMVRDSFPNITATGIIYFFMLLGITFLVNYLVTLVYKKKGYLIKKK